MSDDDFELGLEKVKPRGYQEALFQARLHRVKFLLSKYWWVIIAAGSIGLTIQAYRIFQQEPQYVSSSRMMVSGRLTIPEGGLYNEELINFFGTQTSLMKSGETRTRARARVQAMHPEVTPDAGLFLDAQQEAKTSLFVLQAISRDPKYAQLFLNAVMEEYLAIKRERRAQTTDVTLSVITQELVRLEKELQQGEQELQDFQKENNVVFIQEQSSSAGNYLVQLNNQMAQFKAEYDLLRLMDVEQTLDRQRREQAAAPAPKEGEKPTKSTDNLEAGMAVMQLQGSDAGFLKAKQDIQMLKAEKEDLSKFLKPKHPKIVRLNEEVARQERLVEIFKKQTAEQLTTHQAALKLQMEGMDQRIKEWETKALDLSQRLAEYQRLKSKLARQQTTYDSLSASVQKVDLNKNIEQETVSVLEAAGPGGVIRPNYTRTLGMGFAIGSLFGFGIVFVLNRLDDRLDSAVELQENFDVVIRGQIPRAIPDKTTGRVPLLSPRDNRHVFAESYRNIRSSLLFMAASLKKPRTILVTSAIPGEGKSTVAANLAATFAFSGSRTLLVDADMRRGVSHQIFELKEEPGLSDYLQQKLNWRAAVRPTRVESLSLLPRGRVPNQPGELLLGSLCDLFLQEIYQEYETIIIDSAPLLATDDTSSLSPKVDGVLFVARARFSSVRAMRSALDLLTQRQVNLLGIIFNSVDPNLPGYYDHYRYKQYYTREEEEA